MRHGCAAAALALLAASRREARIGTGSPPFGSPRQLHRDVAAARFPPLRISLLRVEWLA